MKTESFAAQVEDWANRTEAQLLDITRRSIQDLVENHMQVPIAQGGNMPVDTGFLRNSGMAALNAWPIGEAEKPKDAKPGQFSWNASSLVLALANMKMGDTLFFGWVANYARKQELRNGFLEGSTRKWSDIVAKNAKEYDNGG